MAVKESVIGTGVWMFWFLSEHSTANDLHTWKWKVHPVTVSELNGNQYDQWFAKARVY